MKTVVKKLKASNQQRCAAIIGVKGHTSEGSLADYAEGGEVEPVQRLTGFIHQQLSCLLTASEFPSWFYNYYYY